MPAFWVGILYGKNSISSAESICGTWTVEDIEKLSIEVAKFGLNAEIKGVKVLNIAENLLEIARRKFNNKRR